METGHAGACVNVHLCVMMMEIFKAPPPHLLLLCTRVSTGSGDNRAAVFNTLKNASTPTNLLCLFTFNSGHYNHTKKTR